MQSGSHAAGVARAIHQARLHNHQRQTLFDHSCGDVVGFGLGLVIYADVLASETIAFVDQFAACVAIDRQGAGVNPLGDGQLAHQFEHVARTIYVNLVAFSFIRCANFVPAGHMKYPINICHGCTHTLFVSHIALGQLHTQFAEHCGFGWVTHHCNYLMPSLAQLLRQPPADKSSRASDEILHRFSRAIRTISIGGVNR